MDLNHGPSGYEPDELPDCSTPRRLRHFQLFFALFRLFNIAYSFMNGNPNLQNSWLVTPLLAIVNRMSGSKNQLGHRFEFPIGAIPIGMAKSKLSQLKVDMTPTLS